MKQLRIESLGRAVAQTLNDAQRVNTFAKPFTATFDLMPIIKLEDSALRVYAVPQSRSTKIDSRGFDRIERSISVVVHQRIDKHGVDEMTLLSLAEDIEDCLRSRDNRQITVDGIAVMFSGIETTYIYEPSAMRNGDEFFSVSTVSYFVLE